MQRFFCVFLLAWTACTAAAELRWEPLGEPGAGGWLTSLRVNPRNTQELALGGDMLGIGISRDLGRTWGGGFGLKSWEIGDLTYHPENPNILWAGTMSGPYQSSDGGVTWVSKRAGFPEVSGGFYSAPIQRVLIDPANPRRLLAFAGTYRGWSSPGSPKFGYIWQSLDGGETWAEFSSIRPYRNITWVDAGRDWKRLYAVVENQGIYTSQDSGKTWTPALEGLPKRAPIRMVAAHPTDPGSAWTAVGNYAEQEGAKNILPGGIYRTKDGGKSWQRLEGGLPARGGSNTNFCTRFQAIAVSPADPQHLATSDTSWSHDAVYHSADGGTTWRKVLDKTQFGSIPVAYPAGMGATVITFDPSDARVFYVANSETVLRTSDSGATWQDITSSRPAPDNTTWRGHGYSGLCSTRVVFNPFRAGSAILTAMDAGKHLRSDDGLRTWFFYDKGFSQPWGGGNDAAFAGPDGRIVYLATGQHGGQGSIARSDDGGKTWREFHGAEQGLPGRAEATSVHADPEQPDRAWAIMGGRFYSTSNGGAQWSRMDGITGATTLGRIPGRAFPFYVGAKEGVLVTRDGARFDFLPDAPVSPSRIHVRADAPDRPYVVRHRVDNGGVHHWDGTTWRQIFINSHAYDVASDPRDARRLVTATSDDPYHDHSRATGIWISADGGVTWSQANEGLSCLRGKTVAFDPHDPDRLVFGTFGRGFFEARWPRDTAVASQP